jgi:hypothetical protein
MNSTTLTPDRQQYRQVLADLAQRAKETLGEAMHKRIDCAVALVLRGDVTLQDDGTALVGSRTDPLKTYTVNGTCGCQDFTRAPAEGWCAHRISRALALRLARELPPAPESIPVPEPEPQATVAPEPLYEAPASINVRLTIGGRDCQLTLRDTSEARLLVRLEEVLQRFPVPQTPAQPQLSPQQHNAAAMHRPVSGFCVVHGCEMTWNEGKNGRKGWFSHRTDEGWCKGRRSH